MISRRRFIQGLTAGTGIALSTWSFATPQDRIALDIAVDERPNAYLELGNCVQYQKDGTPYYIWIPDPRPRWTVEPVHLPRPNHIVHYARDPWEIEAEFTIQKHATIVGVMLHIPAWGIATPYQSEKGPGMPVSLGPDDKIRINITRPRGNP